MGRHPLGSLLLALATGTFSSCGGAQPPASHPTGPQTLSAKVPLTVELKKTLDTCTEIQDELCGMLCLEAFEGLQDKNPAITSCKREVIGNELAVTVEFTEPPPPASSSGGGGAEPQGCAGGRRPIGFVCAHGPAPTPVAAYLAGNAQLEAASVTAFARIHRYLVTHGAPPALQHRVRTAIAEELEHARLVAELARAYGATPVLPTIAPEPPLSQVERAIENVVEGCVHEAVAALQAAFIATHASDPRVRDVFARLVDDEAGHALLAYDLHAYHAIGLGSDALHRVALAYRTAALRAVATPPSEAMIALGVPADHRLAHATATAG